MNHSHHEPVVSLKPALDPTSHSIKDYVPLLVVFMFIAASSATHVFLMGNTLVNWSMAIMGYFFLFFALFKFIDLPGFKEGYTHYDLIGQRVPAWGYVYPFVELALGLLYLLNFQNSTLYFLTILITVINVVSVSIKLAKKEKFMCACLGTILKVPLTTVTLIEYGLMGLMAGGMLLI
jgi:dolichyl-phosphate-mannose--protein O-mannosyl transferase